MPILRTDSKPIGLIGSESENRVPDTTWLCIESNRGHKSAILLKKVLKNAHGSGVIKKHVQ